VVGRGVQDLARMENGRMSTPGLDVRELTKDSKSLSDVSEPDDDWQNSRRRGRDVSAAGDVAKVLYCGRFFVIGEAEWPLAAKKSERAIWKNVCECDVCVCVCLCAGERQKKQARFPRNVQKRFPKVRLSKSQFQRLIQ
jgi:hypothetical protein